MELLEEYKEPIKLTQFEYEYLKVAKRERFNFIAKDGDGRLFLYKNKPFKSLDEWIVLNDKNGRCLPMPKQGIENIKVLDILTKIIDDDEAAV